MVHPLEEQVSVPSPAPRRPGPQAAAVEQILAIWRDVLGRTDITADDDFFTLGDHSLAPTVVALIRRRLGVDLPVLDVFESRTAPALAAVVVARAADARSAAVARGVTPRPPDAEPVLSFDQQRLWLEDQLLPGVIYNVPLRRRLVGPLDVGVLEASIRAVLARHEALRSRFPDVDGRPIQVVDEPDASWRIPFVDLSGPDAGAAADRETEGLRLLDEDAMRPFDLATGLLLRCVVVRLSDTEHMLGVTMHHIVSDTWSIGLFVREMSALYQAGGAADAAGLPALPVQYRDYAVWQRERLVGSTLERQLAYWRRHLADAPRVLALPAARRRTTTLRAEADRVECVLPPAETAAVAALCRAQGATPFMALLAGLTTVFARWSGQSDVVVGVPLAGRTHSGTDHMIGFFVNVLPFRVDLSGDPTFAELLARVRAMALRGYDHADAPLDALVEDLQVPRDPRRTPLFEVVLNVVGRPESEQVAGFSVEPIEQPSLFSRFDLAITVQEDEGSLRLQLDFTSDRNDVRMIEALVAQLRTLLAAAALDPGRSVLDYPLAPAPEPVPAVRSARARLDVDVARQAAAGCGTAVVDGAGAWSYEWLDAAADRVAAELAGHGLGSGSPVAVLRRPSAAFVAALVGCARAGAHATVVDTVPDAGLVLDAGPDPVPAAIGVGALLPDRGQSVDREPRERVAVLSGAPAALVAALRGAFDRGAALVVPDPGVTADLALLTGWLADRAVTTVHMTPSILRALTSQDPRPALPAVTLAVVDNDGGFLPHDVTALRAVAPGCRCVATYRIAADGVATAEFEVPADWSERTAPLRVPLGRDAADRPVRLIRAGGQEATVGEVGEIVVPGPTGGEPTGDVGRRWPDGSLELVRRVDAPPEFDLLETVAALRDVPGVADAVVLAQAGEDGTVLHAYVVGPDPEQGPVTIHNHVRTRLPASLTPDRIVVLCGLPRTPWGEYDLAALAAAGSGTPDLGGATVFVAPRTSMERELAGIVAELLGIERVGVHDSFFELGGFSLLATQLSTRVRAVFGVELDLRAIFESPTIDELAQLIVRTQGELSDSDDLEALLSEIEAGAPAAEAVPVAAPVAAADVAADTPMEAAVARLRAAAYAPDKPDETPETTARALWFAAAGSPRTVADAAVGPLPALDEAGCRALDELVARRLDGEPLAYLTGRTGFLGLEFLAGPGALVPRQETELLAGTALELATELADTAPTGSARVLDLCTGAGNIAVSVAVGEPRAEVWAADLEVEAVAVAARNAEHHGVAGRVTLSDGDLFACLETLDPPPGPFDLVVCNPPYMPSEKARNLPVEVGGYEPLAAFDGGDVGLSVMYRLIAEAPRHLVPGGWVCFELGAGMGRVVERRLAATGSYDTVRTVADDGGTTRVILARRA